MKKILTVIVFAFAFITTYAAHITGGEMIYEYLGPGSNPTRSQYKVTLKLFRDENGGGAAMPANVQIGVFSNVSNTLVNNLLINRTSINNVSVEPPPPCMTNPPILNYTIGTYEFTIDLPDNIFGYTIAYNTCCRINSLQNVLTAGAPSQGEGSTYLCVIPGTNQLPVGHNSSPQFSTVLAPVCFNSPFTFNFNAIDPDGDSLVYYYCNAYNRGTSTNSSNVLPPPPPYQSVNYINGYSGSLPLGALAPVDSKTGLISGIAPPTVGNYVVCVCILEYRNGVLIGGHRKDFILPVKDCEIPNADLRPNGTTCDGFLVSFENQGSNTNVTTWLWDFGDPASGANNTSTSASPTHDYTASGAGDYLVKLFVNKGLQCEDSAQAIFKVYPGFRPDFQVLGQCKNTPIQFNDLSVHDFGTINKWTWNFGDPASGANNSSILKNPTHVFATAGIYNVTLRVESDKGCSALIPQQVEVKDKPAFTIPRDTLICTIDTLQLTATGTGTIVWSPNYMISDVNSLTPLVSPDVTTTYTATFTDAFGCSGNDDITINVVDRVTQGNNYDTTVCTGDAAQLRLFSNALYYTWTPNDGSLNSTTIKNPIAIPTVATSYNVIGKISDKCFAQNTINITPVPYPNVIAPDVNVCFGRSTQLQATGGSIYNWSPRTYLNSTTIANPTVTNPLSSVLYTLTVRDVLGCPKPVQKTVKLNVVKINANAGPRDTSVVLGQPLQLNATGGVNYVWLPDNRWLSSTTINNPVALPQNDIEYIVQVSDDNGCLGLDSIRVRLFRVSPGLYVPNAFTPNGDGKNDIFRPVVLGIKSLDLFQVYNRFGQMVYSGIDIAKGWDGTFGGRPQDPANFVWVAEATDYTGKKIKRKGNVILIRQ